MHRKSIYINADNDAALKRRFADADGNMNYTQAVNTALSEWRQELTNDSNHQKQKHTGPSRIRQPAAPLSPGQTADNAADVGPAEMPAQSDREGGK